MCFHIKSQTVEKLRDHKFANKFIYCVNCKTYLGRGKTEQKGEQIALSDFKFKSESFDEVI